MKINKKNVMLVTEPLCTQHEDVEKVNLVYKSTQKCSNSVHVDTRFY